MWLILSEGLDLLLVVVFELTRQWDKYVRSGSKGTGYRKEVGRAVQGWRALGTRRFMGVPIDGFDRTFSLLRLSSSVILPIRLMVLVSHLTLLLLIGNLGRLGSHTSAVQSEGLLTLKTCRQKLKGASCLH